MAALGAGDAACFLSVSSKIESNSSNGSTVPLDLGVFDAPLFATGVDAVEEAGEGEEPAALGGGVFVLGTVSSNTLLRSSIYDPRLPGTLRGLVAEGAAKEALGVEEEDGGVPSSKSSSSKTLEVEVVALAGAACFGVGLLIELMMASRSSSVPLGGGPREADREPTELLEEFKLDGVPPSDASNSSRRDETEAVNLASPWEAMKAPEPLRTGFCMLGFEFECARGACFLVQVSFVARSAAKLRSSLAISSQFKNLILGSSWMAK